MKTLLLLITATFLLADTMPKEGFERAISGHKSDACEQAKAMAKARYEIVEMAAGCRCERTDGREWQCDVGFTYTGKKQ